MLATIIACTLSFYLSILLSFYRSIFLSLYRSIALSDFANLLMILGFIEISLKNQYLRLRKPNVRLRVGKGFTCFILSGMYKSGMELIFVSSMGGAFWFSVILACLLGAMSPGPSLIIIVNHTLSQGRIAGIIAALAHGITVGLFAFITASGLSLVIANNPMLFDAIQVFGGLFLLFLAVKLLFSPIKKEVDLVLAVRSSHWRAARDGFIIALINPKVLLFFTALFSQFVGTDTEIWEKVALGVIAGGVDALWYILIALVIGHTGTVIRFQRNSWLLDKIFSVLLFFMAWRVIVGLLERGGLMALF